ncbi:MAG: hypothetical protein J0I10_03450 [Verrucomicrobia bacterium]|nr:hypothetical protein [Verrucomicrobiota bacterium]
MITSGAGKYSFTRSPAEGRILRYRYNGVSAELSGRQFYLQDYATGEFWSTAWQATAKPLEEYETETRFGTGDVVISSRYRGIRSESLYYIPLGAEHEVWRLVVENRSDRALSLDVFSVCEFTTEWNLVNDMLNLQYTQYIGESRWWRSPENQTVFRKDRDGTSSSLLSGWNCSRRGDAQWMGCAPSREGPLGPGVSGLGCGLKERKQPTYLAMSRDGLDEKSLNPSGPR